MTVQAGTGAGTDVTSANNVSSASITINKPTAVADGDVLFAHMRFQNSGGTITPPSGWTQAFTQNAGWTSAIFYKVIPTASAETATSYTFSTSAGGGRVVGQIFRVFGALNSSPLAVIGTFSAETGTTSCAVPAVTAPSSTGLLLAFAEVDVAATGAPGVETVTWAAGSLVSTAQVDNGSTHTSTVWTGQAQITASGTTGTETLSLSPTAANSGGVLIIVASASTPLATPVLTITGQTDPTTPGGSDGTVTVSWPAVSGAVSYEAGWASGNVSSGFSVVATGVTSPYTFTGLSGGVQTVAIKAMAE